MTLIGPGSKVGKIIKWLRAILGWGEKNGLFDKNGNPLDPDGNLISPGARRELDRAARMKPPERGGR